MRSKWSFGGGISPSRVRILSIGVLLSPEPTRSTVNPGGGIQTWQGLLVDTSNDDLP